MLTTLYKTTLRWANHPKATLLLATLSFIESVFFPIPPDIILAPMSMTKPKAAWQYAMIATLCSVAGGMFGYLLGYFLFDYIINYYVLPYNYLEAYQSALQWFNKWGSFAVLIAACTPIPYKMFTIGAGALKFNVINFIIASIVGRGARFFLLSCLIKYNSAYIDKYFNKLLNKSNAKLLIIIIILTLFYVFYKL